MNFNLKLLFKSKKNLVLLLLLLLVLAFAFYLRVYHVDYPVIGYHNWKETHYLTESRNFASDGFFQNGFLVPAWDYPSINSDPSGAHSDSFPSGPIILGILFMIFGPSLILARLVSIFLSLGSIFLVYLIVKKLFKRTDLALISSLVLAIAPLHIFFGRQVQLISYALFFVLLGTYYYLDWRKNFSWKNTVLFSFFMGLGILTKYSYFLFALPIIFTIPYKRFFRKINFKKIMFIFCLCLIFLSWIPYSYSISENTNSSHQLTNAINLGTIKDSGFWDAMKVYGVDNYSKVGLIFVVLGLLFYLFLINLDKNSFQYKFIFFHILFVFIWFFLMANKLKGHSYHQFPLLFIFSFLVAVFILSSSIFLSRIIYLKKLKWLIVSGFIILFFLSSLAPVNRMFDTQFFGIELGGKYLNDYGLEGERVMHSSHQAFGLLWHADMMGTRGIPSTVEEMERSRIELNATWLFIYEWDNHILYGSDERSEYIKNNYQLNQFGFKIEGDKIVPIYSLLKYGGQFSEEELTTRIQQGDFLSKTYELSQRDVTLNYLDL